jgi:hypothetical protein
MNSVLETAITVLILVVCAYYHASYSAGLYSTNSTFVHPNDEPEDFADKWDEFQKLAYTQKFSDKALRDIAFKRVFNATRSRMLYEQDREERWAEFTAKLEAEQKAYNEKLKNYQEQRMQEEMEFAEKRRKDDERYRRVFNNVNDFFKELDTFTDLETLGLSTGATKIEIKKAYRALLRQVHPDKVCNGQSHCKARFLKVQEAYDRLMK